MQINRFNGKARSVVQAGTVYGGIHVNAGREQPDTPIAVSAELVKWKNVTVQGPDKAWRSVPVAECVQVVVQRVHGAEAVITRPRLNVVSRLPARPCYTPPPGPIRSQISLHEMWIADLSSDRPRVEPDTGSARFEFDLADGKAESFLVYLDGLIDPEEDLVIEQECTFWFEVEWMCEGRRGVADTGDPDGWPFFWHPQRPSLGVQGG